MVLPETDSVIQRDHAVANRQARTLWQRERAAFQRQHKAKLESYVEARLALAEERARIELVRANQLAAASAAQDFAHSAGPSSSSSSVATTASNISRSWVLPSQPGPTVLSVADTARHIANQIPARTKEILRGNDELVASNMAHGLPKGLAVFLALLMLHVPSVAIASLVTGTILIRRHSTHAGMFFLGLAAILGVVIFALLPW